MANHANGTVGGDGIGFAEIQSRGSVYVKILTEDCPQAAQQAVDAWRWRGQSLLGLDLLWVTNDNAAAQVEIRKPTGRPSSGVGTRTSAILTFRTTTGRVL